MQYYAVYSFIITVEYRTKWFIRQITYQCTIHVIVANNYNIPLIMNTKEIFTNICFPFSGSCLHNLDTESLFNGHNCIGGTMLFKVEIWIMKLLSTVFCPTVLWGADVLSAVFFCLPVFWPRYIVLLPFKNYQV